MASHRLIEGSEIAREHVVGVVAVIHQQQLAVGVSGGLHNLLGVIGGDGSIVLAVDGQNGGLDVSSYLQNVGFGRLLEPALTQLKGSRQSKVIV